VYDMVFTICEGLSEAWTVEEDRRAPCNAANLEAQGIWVLLERSWHSMEPMVIERASRIKEVMHVPWMIG
jgi:hypothetical protein